jgi:hypothetical protein
MRAPHVIALAAAIVASAASLSAQKAPVNATLVPAADRIAQAIDAVGGEARLKSIKSLRLELIGHGFALEQSERPEGPWLTTYVESTEVRDFEHARRRIESRRRNWSFPSWSPLAISVIDGDVAARTNGTTWTPGTPADIASLDALYALAPEKLLFTARASSDLRSLPDQLQQKVNQHVVAFTWNGQRMRLFLNGWTNVPTMLEIVRNETRFGNWGDITERRWYSFWTLEKGGLLYPRQTTTEWNGFPYTDETVQVLKVDEPVDAAALTIPDETKAAFAETAKRPAPAPPTVFNESRAIDLTDWLVEVPGGFNISVVKQPDGLVIMEATTGNEHAAAAMAFARKRFPGMKIKAVVTTSDAWPHLAGIREYVAEGIPIYALDLNVSILGRFVESAHTLVPDRLENAPKPAIFKPVSSRTVIGTGDTRIELFPAHGEIGERMMLAWFPGAHVLYSSDFIQRNAPGRGTPFFMPKMLMEVETAVAREKITGIERVFGMHLAPTPWADVLAAIAAARAQ